MRRLILAAVGALALAGLSVPQAQAQPAFAIYSYTTATRYQSHTLGVATADPFLVRTRVYQQKQGDGSGWIVRGVIVDVYPKGSDPSAGGCDRNDTAVTSVTGDLSINGYDQNGDLHSVRLWPDVTLNGDNGCHREFLPGDTQEVVNWLGVRVYWNGTAHIWLGQDLDVHAHHWANSTSASTWNWGCSAGPDSNQIDQCYQNGPF